MNKKHLINLISNKVIGKKLLVRPYKTVIIDLSLSEVDILNRADKHSVKKNIERSGKRGVIIKNITYDTSALHSYASILYQSRIKLGIEYRTLTQLINEILELSHNKDYAVFMAYWNDLPVGALGSMISNKKITEQGLTRTFLNDEQKLYCVDALRWHLIHYGKEKGCLEYDLGGISDTTKKGQGIARNKTKWNGKIIPTTKFA